MKLITILQGSPVMLLAALALLVPRPVEAAVILQSPGANNVAFEAEANVTLIPGTPTSFVITNDVTPSGSTALFTSGAVGAGTDYPRGFASYSIKFSTAGFYKFFYRWRANPTYGLADLNTGNSFRMPNKFNASTESSAANPDYLVSSGNNVVAYPASGNYNLLSDNQLLEVTQAQVDAGAVLVFTMGTREPGMTFDRFVLTLDSTLTEAQFNALPNTGADPTPPHILDVAGSATLTNVTLTFSEPLDEFSVFPINFTLSGGVNVLTASLDPAGLRVVSLTTTPQTGGNNYVVTVNGVTDLSGNPILAGSQADFTAWRVAPGWISRELYLEITGSAVADLLASPKYPDQPDEQDVIPGARFINTPQRINYGARVTFFFTPAVTGDYEFFLYNDDEAQLFVSADSTFDQLQLVVMSPGPSTSFSEAVKGNIPFQEFVQGERYAVRVLWKQGTGDSVLAVAARRIGDPTPAENLQPLSGNLIETVLNPDTAILIFSAQPQSTTVTAGSRARFFAAASSPGGPVSYQWQVNGVDIPGATRQAYTTPVLGTGDSGKAYRVIASGGGTIMASTAAVATVVAGPAPQVEPYIGVNFVGGNVGQNQPGGTLRSNDVFGVVGQENFNNISGNSAASAPLTDAAGNPTPVAITYTVNGTYWTGTGESTADHVAFQGQLENANQPIDITLSGVPEGVYQLFAYSVGFAFNASYEQAYTLTGDSVLPTLHVKAQTGFDFVGDPVLRRMSSTNPDARDFGNYVTFEDVSPDGSGNLLLNLTPESPNVGVNVLPTVNALQLVRVLASLGIVPGPAAGKSTVSWNRASAGYTLESSATLGTSAQWSAVNGVANPLPGVGSTEVNTVGGARFFRLRHP
jgi:Bacterial Ig-like domain